MTLADHMKRQLADVGRRLDIVESVEAAKDLHLPIERTGNGEVRIKEFAAMTVTDADTEGKAPVHIEASELEPLGKAFGWTFFAWTEGREVRVGREVLPAALNDLGRVFVHEVVTIRGQIADVGGKLTPSVDHEEDRWFDAAVMPAGSFAAEKARQERATAKTQPRPILSVRPHGWPMGRELVAYLAKHGIELRVVDGALLASSKGSVPDAISRALEDHAALLVGWLTDAPLPCFRTKCKAEAVTLLLGGAAACAEHAGQ